MGTQHHGSTDFEVVLQLKKHGICLDLDVDNQKLPLDDKGCFMYIFIYMFIYRVGVSDQQLCKEKVLFL